MIIGLLLCSCSSTSTSSTMSSKNDTDSNNDDLYIVSLNGNAETDIFKTSVEKHALDKIIKTDVFDTPVEKELQIGNFKTTANLVKSEHFENFTRNTYRSADDTVKYVENTDSTFFQVLAQNNAVLSHIDDDELTEENLVKNIKEYIGGILGDVDYNKYTYSCSTYFVVDSEKGSRGDTRDGFAVSKSENEKVKSYTVKFAQYCNGTETINQITINCDEEGNITNFWAYNYDVDWNATEIDQQKLLDSVEQFIQSNTISKYKVIGFEIESQMLTVKDGEVKLSVTAELLLTVDGDNEWPMLCNFIVDL